MQLRNYQKQALANFENNHCVGMMNMATGTGKTYTSIATVESIFEKQQRQFLVIVVPFVHLIEQWQASLKSVGLLVDCKVYNNSNQWRKLLTNLVWIYNNHFAKRVIVIGTYTSIVSEKFENCLSDLDFTSAFLLADECHYFGAGNKQRNFFMRFPARLGLSATPERWYDQSGTSYIRSLFGEDVFTYSLKDAINNHFLTQYDYRPIIAPLSHDEMEEFDDLTEKINKFSMIGSSPKQSMSKAEILNKIKNYTLRRARLIQSAEVKLKLLIQEILKQKDHRFTLIYCSNKNEITQVGQLLNQYQISSHRFDSDVSKGDRHKILKRFSSGEIEVLIAVKCLDEGVDVLATRVAYFLASTTNPREFVQRRGRVLRLSPGKFKAILYDFVVFPPPEYNGSYAKQLIRHELPRVFDLNEYSSNKYEARKELITPLRKLGLENYLDMSSMDVYEESQKERDNYGNTTKY